MRMLRPITDLKLSSIEWRLTYLRPWLHYQRPGWIDDAQGPDQTSDDAAPYRICFARKSSRLAGLEMTQRRVLDCGGSDTTEALSSPSRARVSELRPSRERIGLLSRAAEAVIWYLSHSHRYFTLLGIRSEPFLAYMHFVCICRDVHAVF